MKKNMDLIREILLQMETHGHGYFNAHFQLPNYTDEEIGYHGYLMKEAGLIQAMDATTMNSSSPCAIPVSITWQGYEFIEDSRDPNVWAQTKQIIDKVGGASIGIWTDVLKKIVMQNLGL